MKAALVILAFACAVLAADPARPAISNQFYAEVRVNVNYNGRYLNGGGVLSYDVPKNMGRTDYKLQNDQHDIETIHVLERFDLHEIFELVDNQKCVIQPTTGSIENPFDWVAKAEYNGTTTYHNQEHDVWVLYTTSTGSNVEQRLYVAASNVNTPVYTTVHNVTGKVVLDSAIEFLSFNPTEPESWVFAVPSTCNSSSPLAVKYGACNSAAVVYWANANWNCADLSCSSRVPSGSTQPSYACAEFTARSLAAGGYMINLQPTDPQSAYGDFRGYDLLDVTGLNAFCAAVGTYTAHPATASAVQAAYAVMGNGGDGAWSHACIGVGAGVDDCHNYARQNWPSSGSFYAGVNAVWAPPGC